MTAVTVIAGTLALLSGAIAAWMGRVMFKSCGREDLRHDGHTPCMFHVVDPYLGRLTEDLYRNPTQDC